MLDAVEAATAAIFWALALRRGSMWRTAGVPQHLWVTIVAVAISQTLAVDVVAAHVSPYLGGDPYGVSLARHLLIVVAAGGILGVVRHLQVAAGELTSVRGGSRCYVMHGALAAVLVLAPLILGDPARGFHTGNDYYELSVGGFVSWAAFLLYLSWAIFAFTRMCLGMARKLAPGDARTGLLVGAAGTSAVMLYVGHKVFVLVGALFVGSRAGAGDTVVQMVVIGPALILITLGSSYPMFATWGRLWRTRYEAWRSVRALYPLWADLAHKETTPLRRWTWAVAELFRLGQAGVRLIGVVGDIRDGFRGLRPYLRDAERPDAVVAARAAGYRGEAGVTAAEAAWLKTGWRAKASGAQWYGDSAGTTLGGADLASETRYLTELARLWREPFVERYSREQVSWERRRTSVG